MGVLQPLWLREEEVPPLPDGWTAMQTADATVQLSPGTLFDTKTVAQSGMVPVLNQGESGFIGYHNEAPGVVASPDRLVVTFANHTCAMRLMKGPFSCIQNIFPKVGKDGVCDTLYFYYAVQGRVNLTDYKGHHPLFRQAYIPIPPLPTQRKIAAILSAYDDLIENNRRRIEILEEMAQALYREWFVEFRFPGHESVPMVDSPLGKIPEGWEVRKLEAAVELAYGKGLRKQDRVAGTFPVYGSSGVVDYHNEPLVHGPGVIVGRKGNVGSVFWCDSGFYPIDTVFYAVTDLPLRYVFFSLQRMNFINNDAAVPGLSRRQAYSLPFVVPSASLLDRFECLAAPLVSLQRVLAETNRSLGDARDLLLPRLISGELDVSDLDIDVGEEVA